MKWKPCRSVLLFLCFLHINSYSWISTSCNLSNEQYCKNILQCKRIIVAIMLYCYGIFQTNIMFTPRRNFGGVYIFTLVCLCVYLAVGPCVCLPVNKIPASRTEAPILTLLTIWMYINKINIDVIIMFLENIFEFANAIWLRFDIISTMIHKTLKVI